jgi:hypothetical protein
MEDRPESDGEPAGWPEPAQCAPAFSTPTPT